LGAVVWLVDWGIRIFAGFWFGYMVAVDDADGVIFGPGGMEDAVEAVA
jgi:hypothetical protein